MADVPQDLLEEIKELERLFTVDQAKLQEITEHFVKELEKGKFIALTICYKIKADSLLRSQSRRRKHC
jgi:predicted transcriptional regulator